MERLVNGVKDVFSCGVWRKSGPLKPYNPETREALLSMIGIRFKNTAFSERKYIPYRIQIQREVEVAFESSKDDILSIVRLDSFSCESIDRDEEVSGQIRCPD
jgi:hypothetical protein